MLLPALLFVIFALLSVAGAYLVARPKGEKLALGLALLTFLFFVALGVGLIALFRMAP